MAEPTKATARLTYDCPQKKSGIHTMTLANTPRLVSEHGPLGAIVSWRWTCEACGEVHVAELGDVLRGR